MEMALETLVRPIMLAEGLYMSGSHQCCTKHQDLYVRWSNPDVMELSLIHI